jgi:alpha-amylase
MSDVCLYFEVHQPFRVGHYDVFQIGQHHDYLDHALNARVLRRVAEKCYLPANTLLKRAIERHAGRFRVAFSFSGVVLEQLELYAPEALRSFQDLVATGRELGGAVEVLAETSHHSLASVYDLGEFREQVALHTRAIQRHFGVTPRVFRNTELVYDEAVGHELSALGYAGALVEGADDVLAGQSPDFVYAAQSGLPLLTKNYRLSDDIAFRFSDRSAPGYPLTAAKFVRSLEAREGAASINLFMDYETFGEHQWAETGIFTFLDQLPDLLLTRGGFAFRTPSEVLAAHAPVATLPFPRTVSWADRERDISAWAGNDMQRSALTRAFAVVEGAKAINDAALVDEARRLTTSDHFYYMSTKGLSDGVVHAYFSPFENPYEAFINYMNALTDLDTSIARVRDSQLPPPPALSA